MSALVACDLCSRSIEVQARYIVRMDVFADPGMPPITDEQLAATDHERILSQLIAQIEQLSADELQDQVHRRFEFSLCPSCHRQFLSNPLGKPRRRSIGNN